MRPEKERLFAESLFVCEGKSCREIAGFPPIDNAVGRGRPTYIHKAAPLSNSVGRPPSADKFH
jgi:hypothetical protein